jgi:oxygen-independent coproporphyrinogen-3 oxidase
MELQELLPIADQARETLVMGLRLEEGIPRARVADAVDQAAIERLSALGLIAQTPDRLRVTSDGMLLLDAILAEIAV